MPTHSGRPEVTFAPHVSAEAARAALAGTLVDAGWSLVRHEPGQLVAEKDVTHVGMNILHASTRDGTAWGRLTATLIAAPSAPVRAVADMHLVSNPRTGLEQVTPVSRGWEKIQALLDQAAVAAAQQR